VVGFVARRDSEGRNLVERLREELAPEKNQLVVLHGPGGVGKTTLAAEAARALRNYFAGRVVWISADGRPTFTLSTLLDETATQMSREDLRQLRPEQKAAEVSSLLAVERPLIVLDNFETIVAVDEQKRCVEFLSQHASCPALITTRQKISPARNITIPAMDSEEAEEFLKLLIKQTSDPSAFARVDLDQVKQVSERNPLIMEWIIAQIDLAQEAYTVLDELTHGGGDAAQRVFDRSFELEYLGDDGRAALLALSLFVPDASRVSLAEVAGFGADLKRLNGAVKRLAGLSLVKSKDGGKRLTIEGLTRELAKARLSRSEFAEEFRRRFLTCFLSYAKSHAEIKPEDFDALEAEKDNEFISIELAVELKDWQTVMRLMDVLSFDGAIGFLTTRGYWEEAVRFGKQAVEAARGLSEEGQIARFSHNLAITHQYRGDVEEARKLWEESLEIFKKLGSQAGIAGTLHQLAMLAQDQGELKEARRLYHESLEINKKLGNQSGISTTLHQLAILAQNQGELEEARRLYHESLEISKKLGNQSGIATTLHNLAVLSHQGRELEEAQRLYHESLEINKKLGNQIGIANTLHQLANLAHDQDKLEEAWGLYHESLGIAKKLGDQTGIALTLHGLGILAQDQGENEQARRLYDESLEINKKLGNKSGIALTLHQHGRLAEDKGDKNEAARLFREALAIFEKLGSPNADIARKSLARVEGKSS
jgi:tetratricopeptide (TPR) repeat protein